MTSKQLIYLDNNATTQIDQRVLDVMLPYLTTNFANANSTHQFGLSCQISIKELAGTKNSAAIASHNFSIGSSAGIKF